MANQPQPQPFLVMRQGPQPDQVYPIDKEVITLGSSEENDIVIPDENVSPHHALITRRGEVWVVEDLGSKAGTWVNGKRITKGVILRQGTRINLGPSVMLTSEGGKLSSPQTKSKGGCKWPALFGGVGFVLILGILLASAAAVGYFYIYPRYSKTPPSFEPLPNLGPEVTFNEPEPGTEVPLNSSLLVFVTARDEKGVTRIDLFVDGQPVISQSSPVPEGTTPFSLIHPLIADTPGDFSMVARAYNREGDMGTSPAMIVTVSEEQAAANSPDSATYIAEEGDTLESIANKSNNSVGSIKNANPGIKSSVKKNRKINIPNPPHPDLPKPPAQPGSGIGNLPGIKPAGIPGAVNILPGLIPGENVGQLLPSLMPKWGEIINLPNAPVKAPDSLKASVKDCTVTLTWNDNAINETEYRVYRQPYARMNSVEIARLGANSTSYVDTVPEPEKYSYTVAAVIAKAPSNQYGFSKIVSVEVKPTETCKHLPVFKQIHFQPLSFTPNDSLYTSVFINTGINKSQAYRIPSGQQTKFPTGKIDAKHKRVFPMPEEFYKDPSLKIEFSISATGIPDDPKLNPTGLGYYSTNYSISELASPDARNKVRGAISKSGSFEILYKLWIDDWKWTGKGTTDKYPPPTNLRLSAYSKDYRRLDWDYDQKYLDFIDGFIVYRQYTCPGEDSLFMWPQVQPKTSQFFTTAISEEPPDCTCKFRMSAFGPFGESNLSDSPKERCQTRPSKYSLEVTFQNLRIGSKTLPKPAAGEVYLFANEFYRKSNNYLFEAKNYDLKNIPLDGSPANNKITVSLAEKESIQLSFYVSNICKGVDRTVYKPPTSWDNINSTINLASADKGCQVAVQIMDAGGGSVPPVGKEPTVYLANGDLCDLNWECKSGICSDGKCVPNGDGKKGDFCYNSSHCSSKVCNCPKGRDGKNCRDWKKFSVSYGGTCAEGWENGDRCDKDSECASGYCADNWRCAPTDKTGRLGDFCHHNEQCGNKTCYCANGHNLLGYCKGWKENTPLDTKFGFCDEWEGPVNGTLCKDNGDCKSNYCANGVCAPRDGSGLAGDYCHHKNHCYSGACQCGPGAHAAGGWSGFCVRDNTKYSIAPGGTCLP
ncbi:FHA domain-containing protein [Chloroflexota bacterium]